MTKERIIHDIAMKCIGVVWDKNNNPDYDETLRNYLNHVTAIRESSVLEEVLNALTNFQPSA
jgi:hypothetical protein